MKAIPQKLIHPRIHKPRLLRDGISWLRVFNRRAAGAEAPFYGINIWRVKKRNLTRSICHMIKLAGVGLRGGFGQVHFLGFDKTDNSNIFKVVLIYKWSSIPERGDVDAPLSVVPAHFSFIRSIEAYNWAIVKNLEKSPKEYMDLIDCKFNEDICYYEEKDGGD